MNIDIPATDSIASDFIENEPTFHNTQQFSMHETRTEVIESRFIFHYFLYCNFYVTHLLWHACTCAGGIKNGGQEVPQPCWKLISPSLVV